MKKLLTILLAAVLFTGCTQTKTADTLTILTSSGYPPFEMVDTEGKLIGFDIELGEAIAKQMGYKEVKWVDMDFDGIIGDLNSPTGTGDMSLAGFNAAPFAAADGGLDMPYVVHMAASTVFTAACPTISPTGRL